jgi:DNA-binding transcriptional MerR regulator
MIKIGDFARLGQVSVPTLRFYAEVGLLMPASVDGASGYRYYSVTQLPRLNRIMALKELGFTLTQIAQILNGQPTLETLRDLLTVKRAETEQIVAEERARLARIEVRLQQIEQESRMSELDVAVKAVPKTLVAACTVTIPLNEQAGECLNRGFDAVFGQIHAAGARPSGPCGALWRQGAEVRENEVADVFVPIDRPFSASDPVQVVELDALTVAAVVYQGGYENLSRMHTAALQWMEDNGHDVPGGYRELYHSPPDDPSPVMEVQYPIQ